MNTDNTIYNIELEELDENKTGSSKMFSENIDMIKNVKVKLLVKLGESELTVDELFNLKEGSVVKLNEEIDAPLDVLLDGKLIAQGKLVAVDDNFGLKITNISNA